MDLILNFIVPVLLLAALGAFLLVQSYMEDPERKAFNKRWFAKHEEFMRLCYTDGQASWRSADLKHHFNRAPDK